MSEGFNFKEAPGHLIRRAHQIAYGLFMAQAAGFGVTPVQFAILNALLDEPGIDQITLSARVAFDAATSGSVLGRLEARAWVRREPDPSDRRRKLLWLTPAGKEVVQKMKATASAVQQSIMEPLNAAEQAQFLALLKRLVAGHGDALPGSRPQEDLASSSKCSTTGGEAKNGPTMARHSAKAGD